MCPPGSPSRTFSVLNWMFGEYSATPAGEGARNTRVFFSFSSSGIPGPLSLFNRLSVLPSGVESISNKEWRRRRRGQWRRLFSLLWERGRREATAGRGSNLELYFSPSPNVLLHFKELFFRTAHKVYAVAYIVGASVRFRPLALASRPYVHQKPLSQSPCIALI